MLLVLLTVSCLYYLFTGLILSFLWFLGTFGSKIGSSGCGSSKHLASVPHVSATVLSILHKLTYLIPERIL